jgi:dihydroneopterin aldolase/2-amino-4-hydroxy-6-hydroxymethyldihydropteridine diphosphokinase
VSRAIVSLSGIEAWGRHGANEGEQLEAQPFLVDLEVALTVEDDALEATADYRALAEAVRAAVAGASVTLLETLADSVARAVFAFESVEEVTATVHKPRAAESLGVVDVAASATVR